MLSPSNQQRQFAVDRANELALEARPRVPVSAAFSTHFRLFLANAE
jgi:hypothetical protein